jgi:hypothetical protein
MKVAFLSIGFQEYSIPVVKWAEHHKSGKGSGPVVVVGVTTHQGGMESIPKGKGV